MKVFLNVDGNVICKSRNDSTTLAYAQGIDASITQEISNAPDSLIYCLGNTTDAEFHKKTSGDGTDISHYTEIVNPLYEDEYAIYDLVQGSEALNRNLAPHSIDYKIGVTTKLQQKFTFNQGLLEKVEYFKDYDENTKVYSNIILEVDMAYTFANELASKRDTTRTWYYKNGSKSLDTKVTEKHYTAIEPIAVNRRRRENLIDNMGLTLIGYLYYFSVTPAMDLAASLAAAEDLLEWHKGVVDDFKRSGDKAVLTALADNVESQFDWLDDTITPLAKTFRTYIIDEMTL